MLTLSFTGATPGDADGTTNTFDMRADAQGSVICPRRLLEDQMSSGRRNEYAGLKSDKMKRVKEPWDGKRTAG